jgi:hypothetical protein
LKREPRQAQSNYLVRAVQRQTIARQQRLKALDHGGLADTTMAIVMKAVTHDKLSWRSLLRADKA